MRTRRIVVAAAATVIAVSTLGYGVASAVVYDKLSKVSGDCPPAWESNDPTRFEVLASEGGPVAGHEGFDTTPYVMPAPETVTIPSREAGIQVSGWYIPADAAKAPTVILVHGLTACKRDHAVLLPAGMLHRHGFSVLLIDLRDHGDSTLEDGRYAGGTEEYRDVLGAWDWLQAEKHVPADRIGLVGVSLGAATVLIATGHEPRVAATWEDSSYADLPSMIRDELTRSGYPTFLESGAGVVAKLISGDDITSYSPLEASSSWPDARSSSPTATMTNGSTSATGTTSSRRRRKPGAVRGRGSLKAPATPRRWSIIRPTTSAGSSTSSLGRSGARRTEGRRHPTSARARPVGWP